MLRHLEGENTRTVVPALPSFQVAGGRRRLRLNICRLSPGLLGRLPTLLDLLIGQFVTGVSSENGDAQSGIVVGVRFEEGGSPVLQLANGSEMPLEQVNTIEPPLRAAEALVGQAIVGLDRRDAANPEIVQGVVTGARTEGQGEVMIELDTGQVLRFRDMVSVTTVENI